MKKLFAVGLILFALLGLVAAADNETFGMEVRQAVMQMHASQLECRVDFLTAMLDYSEEYTGESYDEIKDALESSMNEVKQAAEENNLEAFLEAVKKTKGYFREAVQTIHDARSEAIKNYNGTNRSSFIQQMKDDFDSARKEFTECHVEATRNRISAEIEMNRQWMKQARENVKNLKDRGYKTDKLEDILNEAEENTENMKKRVKARGKGEDVDTLIEERRMRWEHHLYLWAKYHNERLNLFLDRILEKTDGYEERVQGIKDLLDQAISIGDNEYYNPDEFKEARSIIIAATNQIRELVREIESEKGEGE